MRGKVVLVTFLVCWGLSGMLLGGLALLAGPQAAQYQTAALSFHGACHAGHLDACDQELAAQFKHAQITSQADLYWLFFVWWVGLTFVVGAPVAGISLRQRRHAQQAPLAWPST